MSDNSGFEKKYIISKVSGAPVDPAAKYFVLRYDPLCRDKVHRNASIVAMLAYAAAVERQRPALAADIVAFELCLGQTPGLLSAGRRMLSVLAALLVKTKAVFSATINALLYDRRPIEDPIGIVPDENLVMLESGLCSKKKLCEYNPVFHDRVVAGKASADDKDFCDLYHDGSCTIRPFSVALKQASSVKSTESAPLKIAVPGCFPEVAPVVKDSFYDGSQPYCIECGCASLESMGVYANGYFYKCKLCGNEFVW